MVLYYQNPRVPCIFGPVVPGADFNQGVVIFFTGMFFCELFHSLVVVWVDLVQ